MGTFTAPWSPVQGFRTNPLDIRGDSLTSRPEPGATNLDTSQIQAVDTNEQEFTYTSTLVKAIAKSRWQFGSENRIVCLVHTVLYSMTRSRLGIWQCLHPVKQPHKDDLVSSFRFITKTPRGTPLSTGNGVICMFSRQESVVRGSSRDQTTPTTNVLIYCD